MSAQKAQKAPKADNEQAEQKRPDGKAHAMEQAKRYVELFALDEKQAAKFTEMYHSYNKILHSIRLQYRHERPAEGVEPTDEQVEKRMLDQFAQSRAILDVREEYYKHFRTILTAKQVQKIFEDEKFRRDEMRGPRPNHRPSGRPEHRPEDAPQSRQNRPALAR